MTLKILKLISKSHSLIIEEVDGTETLANAKDTFKSGIDPDFKNWGTNKPDNATEKTAVQVYEVVDDASCKQMFCSLETDLDKLRLSQHQIKTFCKKYQNWLCASGYNTFFLFKVKGQFLVAGVHKCFVAAGVHGGMAVDIRRFDGYGVWLAVRAFRVVVPQLTV